LPVARGTTAESIHPATVNQGNGARRRMKAMLTL
jgi:hypothetical protein